MAQNIQTSKLLIPKDFKFDGKPQQQLYKEAISKKQSDPPTPSSNHTPPSSLGKVVPLIGADGKKEFTLQEALAEAKKQNKIMVQLKDSDPYVLKNSGYYWTGDLICYPNPQEKFGNEIRYTDNNDNQNYLIKIPKAFQKLDGGHMLKLIQGKHSDGKPFYEYNYDSASNLWVVQINHEDILIASGLLKDVRIHRNNGYYKFDANLIPNGAALPKGSSADDTFRYFWQVDNGSYLGLLFRDEVIGRQNVNADRRPSGCLGVLVYSD